MKEFEELERMKRKTMSTNSIRRGLAQAASDVVREVCEEKIIGALADEFYAQTILKFATELHIRVVCQDRATGTIILEVKTKPPEKPEEIKE